MKFHCILVSLYEMCSCMHLALGIDGQKCNFDTEPVTEKKKTNFTIVDYDPVGGYM